MTIVVLFWDFFYFLFLGLFKQGAPVAKIEQVDSMKTSNFCRTSDFKDPRPCIYIYEGGEGGTHLEMSSSV